MNDRGPQHQFQRGGQLLEDHVKRGFLEEITGAQIALQGVAQKPHILLYETVIQAQLIAQLLAHLF